MLKRFLMFTGAAAVSLSIGFPVDARQTPASTPQQTGTASATGTMVHFEGCVFPKRALSLTEPVVVQSGKVEDYVLTNTEVVAAPDGSKDKHRGRIFKLEQVDQDRLRALTGKSVGVTGRILEKADQPQLQVVSIREITGLCPRVPTPRS